MSPAIKQVNVATSANALNGLKFDEIPSPGALVTLYASCVTAGDTIGFSVGSEDYLVDAEPNVEIAADVVDTDRDAILVREPCGPGKAFLRIAATTAVNFLLVLEYV
jgi:hypothetical protein